MKNIAEFEKFLRDTVNLDATREKELTQRRDNVQQFLEENLEGYLNCSPQGSWELGTAIKPVRDGQEYDMDMLVILSYEDGMTPKGYIDRVHDTLKESATYKDKTEKGTRAVTIDYTGELHIDLVPCLRIGEQYFICNYDTDSFEPTDGDGYKEWFSDKNSKTDEYLQEIVKLLKYIKNRNNNFSVKPILLTTLAGIAINDVTCTECTTLPDTLLVVTREINSYLQSNPCMPTIYNPALSSEDFNRHWDQEKYTRFVTAFSEIAEKVKTAYETESEHESCESWRKLFGNKFPNPYKSSNNAMFSGTKLVSPPSPYLSCDGL